MSTIESRLAGIRLVVLDCDGVLTDGRLWLGDDGHEFKAFHVQDGHGIKRIQAAGVVVAVISGRRSAAVQRRMAELGIEHLFEGVEDKLDCLRRVQAELGVDDATTLCAGDDLPDLPLLEAAGVAVTVPDADPRLIAVADWQTRRGGGQGAVREICDRLLAVRPA
jgi:3-deoxy-D-manno-octulosonate 8-phosphate phosphatase (KDO 8-P phosphatase)